MQPSGTPTVPNVIGLTQPAAESALKSASLAVGNVKTVTSPTTPVGIVTSANPAVGTPIAQGSKVDMEVSSGPVIGPAGAAVPNVVGLTQPAAESALTSAGLAVGAVKTVSSPTAPVGIVTSAYPAVGTPVAQGLPVDLEVSSGPAQVPVPDVSGLTKLAAEAMVRSAGLVIGTAKTEPSNAVPADGVSNTNPPAGTLVNRGTAVDLIVSSGQKADRTQVVLIVLFSLLCAGILGLIVWAVADKTGSFLRTLADKEVARGLITFLIAITTVGIALILALSTIVLKGGTDDDKRFDRGKQVLTILIGVLGTIVGFYFGSSLDTKTRTPLAIVTTTLPDGAANKPYPSTILQATGGTQPLKWSVAPDLPADLKLDAANGTISGTPKAVVAKTKFTFSVTDSATPATSSPPAVLTLEIKP
jgi:beta-lactam-binding protein with PASTA domain